MVPLALAAAARPADGALCGRRPRHSRSLEQVGWPVRLDRVPVREQLTGVLENDDAVAKQAPALLRMADEGSGRLTVRSSCIRAGRRVRAHLVPPGHFSLWS